MLSPSDQIIGTDLRGADGSVGSICDLLFDTDRWTVRHLVVDTGHWLPGRQVLLPPAVLETTNWPSGGASVRLSRQQVEEAPAVESDRPASRQMEIELYSHYEVPYYWGPAGATLAGSGYTPFPLGASASLPAQRHAVADAESNHLRSASKVTSYYIQAADDDIGHVENLIVDDQDWAVHYLVVDTRNWLPGRKVLIARDWVEAISWQDSTVSVGLTKGEVKSSPEYDAAMSLDRDYEEVLYRHYGRSGYWLT